MSTIGYGNEQVPKTILGKIVTVKCAIFGIICMGTFDLGHTRSLIKFNFSTADTIHCSVMAKAVYYSDA